MRVTIGLMLISIQIILGGTAVANSLCSGPDFSDDQIKEVVRRERFVRTDLPGELSDFTASVRRQRCHYVYAERMTDSDGRVSPMSRIFVLNQYGVIVDAKVGH